MNFKVTPVNVNIRFKNRLPCSQQRPDDIITLAKGLITSLGLVCSIETGKIDS